MAEAEIDPSEEHRQKPRATSESELASTVHASALDAPQPLPVAASSLSPTNAPTGAGSREQATAAELSSVPLEKLSLATHQAEQNRQRETDTYFYASAPTFVSLHAELQQALNQLDTLAEYYTSFERELGGVSSHLSGLQARSNELSTQLSQRQALDERISALVSHVALSPLTVEIILSTEPKAQAQAWADACSEIERVLDYTASATSLARTGAALSSSGTETPGAETGASANADAETHIRAEARTLALSCLAKAVPKIRPYLIQAFSTFKSSVTANLQVLQSSVLLRPTHRGLYCMLARRAPRAAQEVQRAYLSAARLYFETGFRRYTRSLERIRSRSLGFQGSTSGSTPSHAASAATEQVGSGENTPVFAAASGARSPHTPSERAGLTNNTSSSSIGAGEEVLIGDTGSSTVSGAALGLLSRAAGGASARELEQLEREDTQFLLDDERAGQSRLDGPGVVLAYMSDDPAFKATVDALFRSLALTFFDNSSSEYTFLVRYFELPAPADTSSRHRRMDSSASTATDAAPDDVTGTQEEAGTLTEQQEDERQSIVRLSPRERVSRSQKREADTMWGQVMEPVLGHWKVFTGTLLSSTPSPTLLSLLAMARLTETLLSEAEARGVAEAVQGPLLAFKIQAWPLVNKSFDNHVASLAKVRSLLGLPEKDQDTSSSSISTWGFGLAGWMNAAASVATPIAPGEKMVYIRLVSARFARLFVSSVHLSMTPYERMLFGGVGRIRDEIEDLIRDGCRVVADDEAKKTKASEVATAARANQLKIECYDTVLKTINVRCLSLLTLPPFPSCAFVPRPPSCVRAESEPVGLS